MKDYIKQVSKNFSILDLDIQSLYAKFDKLNILLDEFAEYDFKFSAICLQETWIQGTTPDASSFHIPNYVSIPMGATRSSHNGLIV